MSTHLRKSIALADQIVTKAEGALSGLDRELIMWPPDFSAIMWEAVADIALRRAQVCRREYAEQRGKGK
jgi:hypothetical protein